MYRYLQEPPTMSECSPWAASSHFKVQCQASIPTTPAVSAEIHWFFNGARIIESSFTPLQDIMVSHESGIVTSTLEFREGAGGVDDDDYSGDYYCHLVINNNYTDNPSRTLNLQTDLFLVGAGPCNINADPQYESTDRCAGTPSIPISTTTTLTPSNPDSTTITPTTEDIASTTIVSDTSTESVTTEDHTTTSATTPTVTGTGEPQGSPLQVWVYVLVAVAAVFGMIIVVLAILCVGLCLKKNKTEDTYKRECLNRFMIT